MKEEIFNVNGYNLDEYQIAAIKNEKKHTIIVAGAGSGKTLTIIGKIKYLKYIKDKKDSDILCISFTNEACKSLKEKIGNNNITVLTFHKLAIKVLNEKDIEFEITPEDFLSKTIDNFFKIASDNSFIKKQIFKVFHNFNPLKSKEYLAIKDIIMTFINLYNTNNLNKEDLKNIINNDALMFIIYAIITYYDKEKYINNYYDFDDLIKKAMELCNKQLILNYKEIIIDEFQDTSKLRLDFIKALIKFNNASLTVVGDDFQSIYKFSGCDLNIFLNFTKYFKDSKTFKIENTYRNSNQLIKIAGSFVMKNNLQIKKDLKSIKNLENPIKIIYYFDRYKTLLKVIKSINKGEILILGRNNFDIYKFIPKDKITWLDNGYFRLQDYNYNLRYLTVHKSKGLESDNVIVINLEDDILGFPSQKETAKVLLKITMEDEFLNAEERRLFYVALTRTKNYCYLLAPYLNPSIFIKEIKKMI